MPWFLRPVRTFRNVAAVGLVYGAIVATDPRASVHEYVVGPLVRRFYDGEDAHRLAIGAMQYPFIIPRVSKHWLGDLDPQGQLKTTLFTNSANAKVKPLVLNTPVGIAAGLDKNAEAVDSLFQLGFSWVEVGSVTPLPQPGNPRPRVFRLEEDKAIINRYGFNSDGHAAVLARLKVRMAAGRTQKPGQVLAVNLGKNKTGDEVQDYVKGVQAFGAHADALVVNISSPNTPGLRALQGEEKLANLLTTLVKERDNLPLAQLPPLVVKIAPDLSESEVVSIAKAVKQSSIDGVIIGNTTVTRGGLKNTEFAHETGGLSGPVVKPLELRVLRLLRREVGPELTIIGCGGISTGADAVQYAKDGADFVQLYTSFTYRGPGTAALVTEEIKGTLGTQAWRGLRQ